MTFESGLIVTFFSWSNLNSSPGIVANEIASFCIDNKLRHKAFFLFANVGKDREIAKC